MQYFNVSSSVHSRNSRKSSSTRKPSRSAGSKSQDTPRARAIRQGRINEKEENDNYFEVLHIDPHTRYRNQFYGKIEDTGDFFKIKVMYGTHESWCDGIYNFEIEKKEHSASSSWDLEKLLIKKKEDGLILSPWRLLDSIQHVLNHSGNDFGFNGNYLGFYEGYRTAEFRYIPIGKCKEINNPKVKIRFIKSSAIFGSEKFGDRITTVYDITEIYDYLLH